jgi:hypothetical protein
MKDYFLEDMMDYHHCNNLKKKKGSPSNIITPLKDYLM